MPLSYEPSKDMPAHTFDRSRFARQSQHFETLFEDRTMAVARSQRRAKVRVWVFSLIAATLFALIVAFFSIIIWSKTLNTLAHYYQIEAARDVG